MFRMRLRRAAVCIAALAIVASASAAPASATKYVHGAPGLGDPFFPNAGNGGYDVRHYRLEIAYDPATQRLDGTAVIRARATENLDRFNLDLRGFLAVSHVAVGDDRRLKDASFTRDGQELEISPRPKLKDGDTFRVEVEYSGIAEPIEDPDGSIEGFIPTDDGAYVVCEPQGAPGWYPANDNPQDKARFDISVTVPAGLTALSNGVLVSSRTRGGKTTWAWRHEKLMAPYLATATLGPFDLTESTLARRDPELRGGRSSVHQPYGAREHPRNSGLPRVDLRALSLRCDRRDRGFRAARRVCARDPDEGELCADAEPEHARPRAIP